MVIFDPFPIDWIYILLGLLYFVPIYFLVKYYSKTKIIDYLLLAGVFISAIISELSARIQLGSISFIEVRVEGWYYWDGTFIEIIQSHYLFWRLLTELSYSLRIKMEYPSRIIWNGVLLWIISWLCLLVLYFTFYTTFTSIYRISI
ncbi:MAG: hypothetical protein ACXADA_15625 [Candidatus Hodarchaeales archaeon]|jgi:hypothetical protein